MAPPAQTDALARVVAEHEAEILAGWLAALRRDGALASGRIGEGELGTQCRTFLAHLRTGLLTGGSDGNDAAFAAARDMLGELSRSRAAQGFAPTETAIFVFSLKEAVFATLSTVLADDPAALARESWVATALLDRLGLHTMEMYQRSREAVIIRQQREIAELSTPVVRLWRGILALPLIGTLDSERTQVVMENLLQSIVDEGAEIAIIDITGVPTVDTLVAQHLLKTVAAARLMGADCIVSGIRPQIAQTMVHLGVELDVITKSSLADAFGVALRRLNLAVGRVAGKANVQAPTQSLTKG